jgi:tRNA(Ile)-lysidine synthase TilS/MesJ
MTAARAPSRTRSGERARSASPLTTAARRALQPLWNALNDVDQHVARPLAGGAVLAVSGGPDSRSLLESVARWPAASGNHRFVVVSVDHGRRQGSAAEAAAVVDRASALGLPAEVRVVSPHRGDEASLRRARHAALRRAALDHGLGAIVLAHHRGDVAEGLLLHLAGLGGGRGGAAPDVIAGAVDGVVAVRPFLALPRESLERALAALGVDDVVIDEDDLAGKNARGWLRQAVLAPLAERRADVEQALARHARLLREDDEALDALVPAGDVVDAALPPALLRRWLRRRVACFDADPRTSPDAIDAVLRLAGARQPGEIALRRCRAQIRPRAGGHEVAVVPAAPHDEVAVARTRAFRGNSGV